MAINLAMLADRLCHREDVPLNASGLAEIESAVFAALRSGAGAMTIEPLETLSSHHGDEARIWWLLALVLREEQQHERALLAAGRAAALAPGDAGLLMAAAQIRYETGRPAAHLFAEACALRPSDLQLARNHAGALAAEGDGAGGEAIMRLALARQPGWVEGQAYLATMRRLNGALGAEDAGFAEAVRADPGNLALRLGWFHWLAKCRDWDKAGQVIGQARHDLGEQPALTVAALYLASESGVAKDDPALFDSLEDRGDPGLDLARVRHALRGGDPARAAAIAERQAATPAAPLFWPYLSLAWRVLGDPRAAWLDRPDIFIRTMDLGLGGADLTELAGLLRSLHGAAAPYPDQSVRGGTQTDRPLLFRHEPVVRRTREAIEAAVCDYAAHLPPSEPGHPLLSLPRGEIRFAGSWSVRLSAQGYHACHTHPAGWISSALHIALPGPARMGAAPAGWLRFGTPPPELGLDLPPYGEVEPEAGRLVLFPSTMWHGTMPYADGERLSIAFDIRPPRR